MLLGPVLAAVTLSLSDSSVANVRTIPQLDGAALDVHNTPAARLNFTEKLSDLQFYYAPELAWIDVTRSAAFALMHQGGVAQAWWDRRFRLTLSVNGAIGKESYLTAAVAPTIGAQVPIGPAEPDPLPGEAPPTPIAFVPALDVIESLFLGVDATASYAITRRWSLTSALGYEVSGGLGDSEAVLPLRRGPTAGVTVTYALTRDDDLATTVNAQLVDVVRRDARYVTLGLLETWQHRFAPLTTASLGGGASYLRARAEADAEVEHSLLASGIASFAQGYALSPRTLLGFAATATLSTGYNPLVGAVTQQASGSVGTGVTDERASVNGNVQVTQSLPVNDPAASRTYGANLTTSYRVGEPVVITLGGTWAHQVLPPGVPVATEADQWGAFLQVELSAPPMTF